MCIKIDKWQGCCMLQIDGIDSQSSIATMHLYYRLRRGEFCKVSLPSRTLVHIATQRVTKSFSVRHFAWGGESSLIISQRLITARFSHKPTTILDGILSTWSNCRDNANQISGSDAINFQYQMLKLVRFDSQCSVLWAARNSMYLSATDL